MLEYGAALTDVKGSRFETYDSSPRGYAAGVRVARVPQHHLREADARLSVQSEARAATDTTWPGVTHRQQGAAKKANVAFEMRECEVHGAEGPAPASTAAGFASSRTRSRKRLTAVTGKNFCGEERDDG